MADRIYPSAKPAATSNGTAAPSFPATKSQLYGANRPIYRPQPSKPRRSRRGCCCSCCLWLTLLLLGLVFLIAIAGGVFYVVYRPHRPTFSITTIRLAALNVTSSNSLTTRLDLSVTAKNPNKKVVYLYDPLSVSVVTTDGVSVGDGSFPGFVHEAGNSTVMKTAATSAGQSLDATAAADLKKKSSLSLAIKMETKAGVKVGGLKTKKIGVSVTCDGITVPVPKGKAPPSAAATSPDAVCKVKLRIKIWKWYL